MKVTPIPPNSPSFCHKHKLKTLYKKGKLPIKYGFYGEELTKENVTLEHLRPISQGGKTELSNLVLTSANKNQERSVRPLSEVINWLHVGQYFEPFKDLKLPDFDGNEYIKLILNTIKELLNVGKTA